MACTSSFEAKIYNSNLLLDDPPLEYFSFDTFDTLTNRKEYECVLVSMVFYLYKGFNLNKLPHLATFAILKYRYMEQLKSGL
ncbi:hypothetical protein HZ326_19539 [Fusarium oxysporum f. sp. albedinis]|nr:hypothetical protein HZ326_19539 [Fusarium oxysporum f. sp. albedinis]